VWCHGTRHLLSKCLSRLCAGVHQRSRSYKVAKFYTHLSRPLQCVPILRYLPQCDFSDRPQAILDIIRSGERFRIDSTAKMPEQGLCEKCGYISSQVLNFKLQIHHIFTADDFHSEEMYMDSLIVNC
jgi:hypothetical protein